MGELKYITIDDEIILMGTFVNNHYRGNGYFNVLLNELVKTFYNKVIYICCVVSYIFLSIERLGFKQTDESIPYWGLMSNGTNFKYTPSFTPSITPS
jgi:predicted GNAT family acetyltransferase